MITESSETTYESDRPEHVVVAVYLIFCAVLGIFGNGIIVALFAKFRHLNNPSNLLILALAVVDLGMIFLCFPLTIWASVNGKWTFGRTGCNYYGFISMLSGLSVIGILTLMAVDRYIVICRMSIASSLTAKHYGLAIVIALTNAAFWAIMPNLGWSSYALEPTGTSCTVDYLQNDSYYITYIVALFVTCFVVPLSVMVICYWMAQSVMTKREEVQNAITEGASAPINVEWCNQKEVTKMGAMLVFLFLLSWSVIAVVCLWAVFGEPMDIPYPLVLIGSLAAKSSIVLNPLVIMIMIGKFRSHVLMLFKSQPEVTPLNFMATQLRSDAEKEL